jgi:hypothetical protein
MKKYCLILVKHQNDFLVINMVDYLVIIAGAAIIVKIKV